MCFVFVFVVGSALVLRKPHMACLVIHLNKEIITLSDKLWLLHGMNIAKLYGKGVNLLTYEFDCFLFLEVVEALLFMEDFLISKIKILKNRDGN